MPILGASASGAKSSPVAPTNVSATDVGTSRAYNNGAATVTFTAPASKLPITSYTVTSSPGGFTGTGSSSPITVTGLQSATAYTFTVTATSAAGTSSASSASNSITATTIPQVPTITSATRTSNTAVSIAFTGATGGAALSSVTATSSPSVSITSSGTSSPMTATATYTTGQAYTFTITATNANGTSSASSASSSVTPYPAPVLSAWSTSTAYPFNNLSYRVGDSTQNGMWYGTGVESGLASNPGWYWNGSSWSQRYYPINAYDISLGRFSTDTLIGIGGETNASPSANVYYSVNGAAWTTGTAFPVNTVAGAALKVSGGFYANRGSMGTAGYYCTTAGGAWTAGSAYGGGVTGPIKAADFNLTEGYALRGQDAYFYKLTSASGSWSQSASNPVIANNIPHPFLHNINNSRMLYHANSYGYGYNTYLFDGTSLTASTSLPTAPGSDRRWSGGAVGATISALNSEAANQTAHYRATLS